MKQLLSVRRLAAFGVGAGLVLLTVPTTASPTEDPATFALSLVCALAGGAALLWPTPAASVVGLCLSLLLVLPNGRIGVATVSLMIVLTMVSLESGVRRGVLFGLWFFAVLAGLSIDTATTTHDLIIDLDFFGLAVAVPIAVGRLIAHFRRTAQSEREAKEVALKEQRRAVARELHDTIAHETTSIVMRTERLRKQAAIAPAVDAELVGIADSAREATKNLRAMLAVLRQDGEIAAARDAAPLAQVLEEQVARLRDAGFTVSVDVSGDPSPLAPEPSAALGYSLIEAVSNAITHGDTSTEVGLIMETTALSVDIALVNSVAPVLEQSPAGSGLGLIGMQERLSVHGGSVQTVKSGARWMTRISMPLDSSATAIAPPTERTAP